MALTCLKKLSPARSQQASLTPMYYMDAGVTQVYTNGDVAPYVNWTANGYRLPTEAEWEKAARGGFSGQWFPWGDTISESNANPVAEPDDPYSYDLGLYGGYNTNFDSGNYPYSSPVGYFAPNVYPRHPKRTGGFCLYHDLKAKLVKHWRGHLHDVRRTASG